jgi:hypothetical protein
MMASNILRFLISYSIALAFVAGGLSPDVAEFAWRDPSGFDPPDAPASLDGMTPVEFPRLQVPCRQAGEVSAGSASHLGFSTSHAAASHGLPTDSGRILLTFLRIMTE